MCTQHLETFHRFYEKVCNSFQNKEIPNFLKNVHKCFKINDIQKVQLSPLEYERHALQPEYNLHKNTIHSISLKKNDTVVDDEGNTFEILVISEGFDAKPVIDHEIEEFELLEVENGDANMENNRYTSHDTGSNDTNSLALVEAKNDISVKTVQKGLRGKRKPNSESIRKSARQLAKAQNTVQNCQVVNSETASISTNAEKANESNGNESINETRECEAMQQDGDIKAEGESDDEFPARDSDNEDWPSQETLDGFPKTIIQDGLLIVKGKQLTSMISRYGCSFLFALVTDLFVNQMFSPFRFYNLECKKCDKKPKFK